VRVYIAGRMTGLPDLGFAAFDAAAALLRSKGYEVVNPAERDRARGIGPSTPISQELYRQLLAADVSVLLECEGICLLPGWEESRGARLEKHVAEVLGFEFIELPASKVRS